VELTQPQVSAGAEEEPKDEFWDNANPLHTIDRMSEQLATVSAALQEQR
jgi:hypothetical protein